jgi:hypothetical protein
VLKQIVDRANRHVSAFNPQNGFYVRTGVINEKGRDNGVDPFMAYYPQLIGIGIMGNCIHGASGLCLESGVQCYQGGAKINEPNMKLSDLKRIIDECRNKTFQVALGGRGDRDSIEKQYGIICDEVNTTTKKYYDAGKGLVRDEIKEFGQIQDITEELADRFINGSIKLDEYFARLNTTEFCLPVLAKVIKNKLKAKGLKDEIIEESFGEYLKHLT